MRAGEASLCAKLRTPGQASGHKSDAMASWDIRTSGLPLEPYPLLAANLAGKAGGNAPSGNSTSLTPARSSRAARW